MWFIDRNREQLVDFFHSRNAVNDNCIEGDILGQRNVLHSGVVRLIWNSPPLANDLPSLVLLPKEDAQEFFAWANTYLPGWRPISSLIRIMSNEVGREIDLNASDSPPVLGFESGALGLVVGEALTHTAAGNRRIDGPNISIAAYMATCSFAIGRSIGLRRKFTRSIGQRWFRARKIVDQPTVALDPNTVFAPWAVLSHIAGNRIENDGRCSVPTTVFRMCERIHKTGVIDNSLLNTISKGWPDIRGAFQQMEGPWEMRVKILERALIATMQKRKTVPDAVAFLCGLLASRVAPGTVDHASLLVPYLQQSKGLLLWYGLCAGLVQGSNVLELPENLSRRILRDMLAEESVFSKPRCDISLEELQVLSVAPAAISKLQNGVSGQLTIEILPCVTTVVRWPTIERKKNGYATLVVR